MAVDAEHKVKAVADVEALDFELRAHGAIHRFALSRDLGSLLYRTRVIRGRVRRALRLRTLKVIDRTHKEPDGERRGLKLEALVADLVEMVLQLFAN